ncbi:hypothetical protein DPEC_G00363960 [Dallia pectoralis]|nr:hypothetical protein DPEC_G00363960 [Dallia pectoralis]
MTHTRQATHSAAGVQCPEAVIRQAARRELSTAKPHLSESRPSHWIMTIQSQSGTAPCAFPASLRCGFCDHFCRLSRGWASHRLTPESNRHRISVPAETSCGSAASRWTVGLPEDLRPQGTRDEQPPGEGGAVVLAVQEIWLAVRGSCCLS